MEILDYWCFTHIVDARGNVAGYLDHQILNGEPPTNLWRGGDVVIEKLVLQSSAFQSGESYRLRLGVFDLASGERLPISSCDFPLTDNQTAAIADEKTNLRLILIRFEKPYGKNPDH